VAKDICDALGYKNISDTLNKHVLTDERSSVSLGRQGKANTINESGMYALVLKSRKTEAIQFRKWITAEVLPQIRQTGSYTYEQPKKLTYVQANAAREVMIKFIKDYGISHAPKGQIINTRHSLMQVHSFVHRYFNVGSYKSLNVGEVRLLKQTLKDNASAIFATVKDLFIIDLKDNNAIFQSKNSIRIAGKDKTHHYSVGHILEQLEKADNQKVIQVPAVNLPSQDKYIPRHIESIIDAVQGTLVNCNNQLDMIKSETLNLDLGQRLKIIKSIIPNFKVCICNIEVVSQSMFVDNYKEAEGTTAKEVLDNIGYSNL